MPLLLRPPGQLTSSDANEGYAFQLRAFEWRALGYAQKRVADSIKEDPAVTKTPIPIEQLKEELPLASANIRYLSAIVAQLQDLLNEPSEDGENGALRANKQACMNACELLTNAAITSALKYNQIIPYGCASLDSEGGIRIEWVRPSSGVRLVVPIDKSSYVYHEVGDQYAIEKPATAESLALWLREIK
jgi:hypothetical protein